MYTFVISYILSTHKNEKSNLINVYMKTYRIANTNKTVVTLLAWYNADVLERNLNFLQVLQFKRKFDIVITK